MMQVTLRALEPEDLDLLYSIENDRDLWDVSTTNVPYSRYILYEYISKSSGDIYADGQVRLIIENEDKETIGIVDLTNFDSRNQRAELGIILEKPYRYKGYGSAVIKQITDYCTRILHLHLIYAIIDTLNTSSISLFKKNSFVQSAILHEWLYDGITYRDAFVFQKTLVH
jgi:diamine N-acetyltransferase